MSTERTPVVGSILILSVVGVIFFIEYSIPSNEPLSAGALLWNEVFPLLSFSASSISSLGVYSKPKGADVTFISSAFSNIPSSSEEAPVVSFNEML